MATTTENMNGSVELTTEQKKELAVKNRNRPELPPRRPREAKKNKPKSEVETVSETSVEYKTEWLAIFNTMLRNRDAKTLSDVQVVTSLTDSIVDELVKKGKL